MSRSEPDITLSAWAHAYAEQGWPVFPLIPQDKRPITADGFKSATTDQGQISAWWKLRPTANIGIATGHAFDVLDVDGEVGVRFLHDFWDDLGLVYHHGGPLSLTGKGWHMLFAPTGAGNRANLGGNRERATKLDYRGIGGYIVAPPSIHPLGHRYAWDTIRGQDAFIPEAPSWLRKLLDIDDNPAVVGNPSGRSVVIKASPTEKATEYLRNIEEGLVPMDQLPRGLRQRFERPDILEVCARQGLHLRKRTHYYVATCPFHADSTPSMAVYPSNNTFYCYGCNAHGDSFDLERGNALYK